MSLQPCGTKAAYQRHLARAETPCDACKAAAAAYERQRRADCEQRIDDPDGYAKRRAHYEALAVAATRHRTYTRHRTGGLLTVSCDRCTETVATAASDRQADLAQRGHVCRDRIDHYNSKEKTA